MSTKKKKAPICLCHRVEMIWHKKNDRESGGSWQCRVKGWEEDRRYNQSTKGYVTRRKRELMMLRKRIVIKLRELEYVKRSSES